MTYVCNHGAADLGFPREIPAIRSLFRFLLISLSPPLFLHFSSVLYFYICPSFLLLFCISLSPFIFYSFPLFHPVSLYFCSPLFLCFTAFFFFSTLLHLSRFPPVLLYFYVTLFFTLPPSTPIFFFSSPCFFLFLYFRLVSLYF